MPGPLGQNPFSRSPWTPSPLGHNDAASPFTPAWFVGATPGPLGVKDHGDPNPIRLYRPIKFKALVVKVPSVPADQGQKAAVAGNQPWSGYTVVVTDASFHSSSPSEWPPPESYDDKIIREAWEQHRYGDALCDWACQIEDRYAVAARKREVPLEGKIPQTIVLSAYTEVLLAWSLVTYYKTGADWKGEPTTIVHLLAGYGLGRWEGKVGKDSEFLKKLVGDKELREKLGEFVGEKSSEKILEMLEEEREFEGAEAPELSSYRLTVVFPADKLQVRKPIVPSQTLPAQKETPAKEETPAKKDSAAPAKEQPKTIPAFKPWK